MQDKFEHNIKSRLEHHEMTPPPMAWEHISTALQEDKPRGILWTKWLSIAAAFVVPAMIAVGFFLMDQAPDKNTNHPAISTQSPADNQQNDTTSQDQFDAPSMIEQHNVVTTPQDEIYDTQEPSTSHTVKQFITNLFSTDSNHRHASRETSTVIEDTNEGFLKSITNLLSGYHSDPQPAFTSPELYAYYAPTNTELQVTAYNAEEEKKEIVKAKNKSLKLEFSPYAGMAMLGSLDQPSLIAPEFNSLEIDNQLVTSYGANASYQLNDRLKLRSGVGVIDMTQNTYDVPMRFDINESSISHNVKSFTNLNVDFSNYSNVTDFSESAQSATDGGIKQNLSHQVQFIEVPMEVEYALTQGKKLNVAATGGMSTLFLNKNDVYLKDINSILAKSTNIKSVSFSANAGLKMDYNVTEKVSVNVEPQIKYMINTVTANDEIQPYLLGVNAGISYSL